MWLYKNIIASYAILVMVCEQWRLFPAARIHQAVISFPVEFFLGLEIIDGLFKISFIDHNKSDRYKIFSGLVYFQQSYEHYSVNRSHPIGNCFFAVYGTICLRRQFKFILVISLSRFISPFRFSSLSRKKR